MSSHLPNQQVVPPSLVDAWRADTASPAELRHGYGRFLRRRPRRGAWLRLASGVLGGLLLGLGLAEAATLVPARWLGAKEVEVKPNERAPRVVKQESAGVAAPNAPAAARVVAESVSGPAVQRPRPQPAPVASEPEPFTQPYVQKQWQRAAAAMRSNDFAQAQAAFIEIERSAPGGERDAARLARAQLLAKSGRNAEALALARGLQAQAQSSIVRDQAAELAGLLDENRVPNRSTEPGAAAKQP